LPHDSQNFSLAVSIANIRRGDVWQEVEVASVGSQAIWPSFGLQSGFHLLFVPEKQ
jgi:hypothetical protein